MKKKSILRAVLTAVLTLVATTASAHDFYVDGIYYKYNGGGTVSVIFKGSTSGEYADEYTGDVVIPSSVTYSETTYSVTSIGNSAFSNCSGLTSVTIPNSVTSIGKYAFNGCSGLTSVTIPNSVTSIGDSAFEGCSGLTSVTIPNSVSSIGYMAFYECSGLTSVSIPNSVKSIGNSAFYKCSGLTSVTIPNSVTSIGEYAFRDCNGLTSVTIPNSVTSIGNKAFTRCSGLESIVVESGNSKYDSRDNCNAIIETATNTLLAGCKNTIILNSVTSIGESAFWGCSGLTSVNVPNSVTSIGEGAFALCSGLKSVTIPNSVKSIGDDAFYNCSGLTSVTIPNSVTEIGKHTFCGCSGLTSVTIPNSVTSIRSSAFYKCSGLTSVTIPNSVTSIGDNAFYYCSGLTSVTIGNSVKSIGVYAFEGCSGLTSVTILTSSVYIGSYAFEGCSGLTRVDISSIEAWLGIKFADLTSNPLFYAQHLYLNGEEVKDLAIPNSVSSIGNYAFHSCSGLTSVSIPNSVKSIGNSAFSNCSGLKSVDISSIEAWLEIKFGNSTSNPLYYARHLYLNGEEVKDLVIPNSVSSIGYMAFYECSGLTSVSIPNSVTSIGEYAFYGCSSLTSVSIPNSVTSIGDRTFSGCSGLKTIFYNAKNCADKTADSYVFNFWTSNLNIIIGKDVTNVPNYLFYSLSKAPARVISQSVTPPTCGAYTFNDKANGAKLYVPSEAESDYFMADVWDIFDIATVDKPVTSIALSESEATIALGSTKQLTATAAPSDATISDIFKWSSSNPEVAVVDGNGLVSAVGEGTTVITAKAFDGSEVTGTCNITVRSFNATSITLNYAELNMFEKDYTSLTYTILPEDATVKTAEWSASDSNVLTSKVMSDGSLRIVAKSAGTATITARTTDGSNLEATCLVTVYPVATNVNQLKPGTNKVKFGLQGVKMHDGVLYACTTAESVNKSTPTLHGNNAVNMDTYEDRNFAAFDQRDWVAISGLVDGFVGKELSYPFVATFAEGVLTPSETINDKADATPYTLNTFRAENILHGGYSNYAEGNYKAYYVPVRVNEVAKFMGLIETVGGVKYLYSNNAYGRKDGEGIKIEGNIADNSESYSLLEGILVADASTKARVKIIMLQDLGEATGVEGVDTAAARIYSANGNIIIAAVEDGEAAVYDFTGRLIKSVPVASGDSTAVPVTPGYYIVKTETKTQSVVVK